MAPNGVFICSIPIVLAKPPCPSNVGVSPHHLPLAEGHLLHGGLVVPSAAGLPGRHHIWRNTALLMFFHAYLN